MKGFWEDQLGDIIRLSTAPMKPVAADEVAAALAEIATGIPLNKTLELAGPESLSIVEFIRIGIVISSSL